MNFPWTDTPKPDDEIDRIVTGPYGDNIYALKSPIGYHPVYSLKPLWWIALYKIRVGIWRIENWLFSLTGHNAS